MAGGTTVFPRWLALLSPFALLLLVFASLAVPAIGWRLVPAAMNVAHVVFFGVVTAMLARE